MMMRQKALLLVLLLFFLSSSDARSDILFNGTNMYLATGESRTLYQGYVISLKSVSIDGSMWFQLIDNETIVKSEIVERYGSLVYNRSNKTIISLKVDKVYSGQSEQHLVSFFLYQFNDPEKPFPNEIILPENTATPKNNYQTPVIRPSNEFLIWVLVISLIMLLFYMIRKLW